MAEQVRWTIYDTPAKRKAEALRRIDNAMTEMRTKLRDAEGQLITARWIKPYSDELNTLDPSGHGVMEVPLDEGKLSNQVEALSASILHWTKVRGLVEQQDFD